MGKNCSTCGKSLGFVEGLVQDLCQDCRAIAYHEVESPAAARIEAAERKQKQAAAERYARAKQGNATKVDLEGLKSEGYVFVDGRLLVCPLCGHERFHQQQALLNTRGATFLGFDWANRGAEANICLACKHIVWFARE